MKDETPGELQSSMCKLKSPVIKSSQGEEARSESIVDISEEKEAREELGGRYTVRRMKA